MALTLTSTTLTRALDSSALVVYVASATNVLVGDLIFCGREAMRVDSVLGLVVRVSRGYAGTLGESHPSGATVYAAPAWAFYIRDPVGVPPSEVPVTPWINLATGVVWTVVAGVWAKTDPAPETEEQTLTTAVAVNTAQITTLGGAADGLGSLRVARATFDPSANTLHRAQAAIDLGVTIPINALIVGGVMHVNTVIAGVGASVAISVEGAGDIQAAAAIAGAPWSTIGRKAIVPKANTPESTSILTTAARAVTATTTGAVLTAGKVTIFLYYVQSAAQA